MNNTSSTWTRRAWLSATAGAAFAGSTDTRPSTASKAHFSFAHFTEIHITDRLRAQDGCRQCFTRMNKLGLDFAIAGGDLVYDVCATGWKRSVQLYSYYREAASVLEMPVRHVLGNHDVYGLFDESGVSPSDRYFGKRLFEEYIGPRHYSFDHQGWHFIVLDSVDVTKERQYIGRVDDQQLAWLKNDLAQTGPHTPIIVITHIPLVTAYLQYGSLNQILKPEALVVTNARQVWALLQPYRVKAVLQGHLHIREVVENRLGCSFITSGAVCGNWWRGPRDGHPEGFNLLTVRGEELSFRYITYGFQPEQGVDAPPEIVDQSTFSRGSRTR